MTDSNRPMKQLAVGAKRLIPRKTLSAAHLMAYGAATWDWQRVHYDLAHAQQLGFPNVFVDGQAYGSMFAQSIMGWFGPKAFIRKMAVKYHTMVFAGETIDGVCKVVDLHVYDDHAIATVDQLLRRGQDRIASSATEVRIPRE